MDDNYKGYKIKDLLSNNNDELINKILCDLASKYSDKRYKKYIKNILEDFRRKLSSFDKDRFLYVEEIRIILSNSFSKCLESYSSNQILEEDNTYNGVQNYFDWISENSVLTDKEVADLCERIKLGDKQARDQFIQCNLKFVVSVAKGKQYFGLDFEDLIQVGNLGLMKALEKFDYKKSKFSTYAKYWIEQAIENYAANEGKIVPIPAHLRQVQIKLLPFIEEYKKINAKEPTDEEICKKFNIKRKALVMIKQNMQFLLSTEAPIGETSNCTIADFIPSEDKSVEEISEENRISHLILELFTCIDEREREILKYKFGFYDKPRTLEEIAEIFGVSHQCVAQIVERAINAIKDPKKNYKSHKRRNITEEQIKNQKIILKELKGLKKIY